MFRALPSPPIEKMSENNSSEKVTQTPLLRADHEVGVGKQIVIRLKAEAEAMALA